ncbi:hypothetical protein GCM10007063_25210 [Lentibacillus kapialis]|uniref:N-acetyltransferase domain-containing protein n=1 Tax=Lentibacillus kapialis TaxID=340214 RepID=A0A917UZS7_9BACI|nr:N-acetyltransferase [Lentibacillus kapialis]GGK01905.1 hypothetical protein GCM10007063_25210 [Lentibacillus kapialis]
MTKTIRMLDEHDYPYYKAMDTGFEFDYIKYVFNALVHENNRLYGLFIDDQLVSVGGYSLYAGIYVMLGRLRSDRRFMGNGFSTEIASHVMHEALNINGIRWVGGNTQEHNMSAQRVLEKIGLVPYITMYGALTKDTTVLESGAEPWQPITNPERKKEWLHQTYIQTGAIFPYECYYSFPASAELFQNEELKQWSFYENPEKTRFLITKYDQKKHHYLHAVYPWHDITSQSGLWETIATDYQKPLQQTNEETYIWMDLTKEKTRNLPANHPFELPSPWILYGKEIN